MLLLRLVVTSLGVNVIAGMPQTANVRNNENQQGPLPSSSSPAYDSTRDLPEKLFKTLILTGIGVEAARRIWVAGVNEGLKRQGPLPQHPPADGGDIVDEEIAITVDDVKMSLRLYHWLGYLTGACVADRSAEFEELSDEGKIKMAAEFELPPESVSANGIPDLIDAWNEECSKKSLQTIRDTLNEVPAYKKYIDGLRSVQGDKAGRKDKVRPEDKTTAETDVDSGAASSSFDLGQKVRDVSQAAQPWAAPGAAGLITGALGWATLGKGDASAWQGG